MTTASIPGSGKTIIEDNILDDEEIMVEDDKETIIKKCNDNNLPKFKIFRKFIYVLAALCYVSYSIYLIIQLATEYPMVITKYNFVNNIDVPSFFEILRCDTKLNNSTNIQNGCQKYISGPNITEGGGDQYCCYTFKANKTIQYIHGNPDDLNKLKFYYKIDNATDAVKEKIGVALIQIRVSSPDLLDVSEMDKAVRSRLELDWNFMPGIIGHVSLIKFKTSIYKSIPPLDVSAIIGLGPNYAITPRYDCIVNYFPLNQNPPVPDGTNGYFSVAAGDFVQEEISEKRQRNKSLDTWGFARRIAVNPWYLKDILVNFGYTMIGRRPESKTIILNDEQLKAAIPRKFLDTSFFSNSQGYSILIDPREP
nr:3859_t:CDS:2 [Entrophospora candida]